MDKIWYKETAKNWREALPVGNGFTGVMVYGSSKKERLCFNDGTLWSGYPKDYNNSESLENLPKVRELIFEGKNCEADTLCENKLKGFYSETFLPLGDVLLTFGKTEKNITSRSLDLSTGIHTVSANGFSSEIFSSYPDKVTVYKVKSSKSFSVKIKAKSKLVTVSAQAQMNCIFTELHPIMLRRIISGQSFFLLNTTRKREWHFAFAHR